MTLAAPTPDLGSGGEDPERGAARGKAGGGAQQKQGALWWAGLFPAASAPAAADLGLTRGGACIGCPPRARRGASALILGCGV